MNNKPYVPSTALQAHVLWAGSVLDQFHLQGCLTRTMLERKRDQLRRLAADRGNDLTNRERSLLELLDKELASC